MKDAAAFLSELMTALGVSWPVLVSPSMSGRLSLPLLTEHPQSLRGFVAIAPVNTDKYVDKYAGIKVHVNFRAKSGMADT